MLYLLGFISAHLERFVYIWWLLPQVKLLTSKCFTVLPQSFFDEESAKDKALELSGSYLGGWKIVVARGNYSDYVSDDDEVDEHHEDDAADDDDDDASCLMVNLSLIFVAVTWMDGISKLPICCQYVPAVRTHTHVPMYVKYALDSLFLGNKSR